MLLAPADAALRRLVDTEKACLRAKDLTKQLLAFSRGGLPVRKPITLEPLVRESARLILQDTRRRTVWNGPRCCRRSTWTPSRCTSCSTNLLTNATQATPHGRDDPYHGRHLGAGRRRHAAPAAGRVRAPEHPRRGAGHPGAASAARSSSRFSRRGKTRAAWGCRPAS